MFIGHFALALASKRAAPRTSLGVLFAASQLPDLLWPILLLFGWERVAIAPASNPFLHLTFISYPWSHSLVADLIWAVAAGVLYAAIARDRKGAVVVGLLVLSHWALDFVAHRPDLPLYPGGPKLGLGLWNSLVGTVVIEGGMFLAGLWLYLSSTRPRDAIGRFAPGALFLLLAVIYVASLMGPPPPSVTAIAWAGLLLWPLLLWAHWGDRHRDSVFAASH